MVGEKVANNGGMIAFGALEGGIGAELSGGNFFKGFLQGGIVSGLNHAMHDIDFPFSNDEGDGDDPNPNRNPKQDKKLTPGEIGKLKEAGWDHSDKKSNGKGGGGNDLWKDKKGNVYEKPKSGAGWGEWTGYNLNNLIIKVSVGAALLYGVWDYLDILSRRAMPFIMITPFMMDTINPQPFYKKKEL